MGTVMRYLLLVIMVMVMAIGAWLLVELLEFLFNRR
jgi:hypothetical protein